MLCAAILSVELITPHYCPFLEEAINRTMDRMVHCEAQWTRQCEDDWRTLNKLRQWSSEAQCDLVYRRS